MIVYQDDNSSIPYNFQKNLYEDFRYVQHFHRDYELVYVMEGTLNVTVENRSFLLQEDSFALILQDQIHSFETDGYSKVCVCVFASEYVNEFQKLAALKTSSENRFALQGVDAEFVKSKLIFGESDRLGLCACLTFVCSEFLKQVELLNTKKEYDRDILHRMLLYITEHYKENISLKTMAEALGYEEHYLSRCFHSRLGKNFKSFVNEYRLNYAKYLLSNEKDMSVTEVAYASGFQTVRNFNRVFIAEEKVSPKKYV